VPEPVSETDTCVVPAGIWKNFGAEDKPAYTFAPDWSTIVPAFVSTVT
jgi:hypothetical protein